MNYLNREIGFTRKAKGERVIELASIYRYLPRYSIANSIQTNIVA